MNKQLLLALFPLLLAACASADSSTTSNASREERVYRTGSNVPVRDPVSSSPTTTADPSALRPGAAPRIN